MDITFDPPKRDCTLRERGLDFDEARAVFAGNTLDFEDERQLYPEAGLSVSAICAVEWLWWCGRR